MADDGERIAGEFEVKREYGEGSAMIEFYFCQDGEKTIEPK